MSYRLFASVMAQLPDNAVQQASDAQRIMAAWTAFLEAMKELPIETTLSIGPVDEPRVRRRRGRPRLTVAEPPTAA